MVLKAENKSMRRQISVLRGNTHNMQAVLNENGVKVTERGEPEPGAPPQTRCPECGCLKFKTVTMSHRDAHKCNKCGKLWLTGGSLANPV